MSVPRQGRGRRIWLVAAIVVIIVVITAALFWRGDLTGRIAEALLQRQFHLGSQISVTDIDTGGASFSIIRLGRHGEAQFKDVRVDYATNGLAMPVLQHIDIGEATIQIGYDGNLHFGDLDRLMAVMRESDSGGQAPLPIVILHKLTFVIDTPLGRQNVTGMATYDKDTLFTNLNWTESNGAARFNTTATIRNVSTRMAPEGQLQASIAPQSRLWQLLPSVPPKAGLISLDATLSAGNSDTPGPRLQIGLSAQGVDLPQLPTPVDLHIVTSLQAAGNEVMPPKTTPKTIVFRDFAIDLKGGPSPTFAGSISNGAGTIDLSHPKPQITADLGLDLRDQSLPLGDLTLREPTVSTKLHVTYDGSSLVITPTDLSKLTLLDLSGAPFTLPSLLTVPLQTDGSQFIWSANRDSGDQMALSLALGDIKAQVLPAGQKTAVNLTVTAPKLSFAGNELGVIHGKASSANIQVTRQTFLALLANLQLDFSANTDDGSAAANLAVSDLEMPNVAASLRLASKASLKSGKTDFSITVTEPKSKEALAVNGNYDLARQTGKAHIDLPQIAFATSGLQPGDFAPVLRNWTRDIAGTIALRGDVNLAADGSLNSDLSLALGNLSGKFGPAIFKNLNSVIQIDHPWPFSTAPGQHLAVEQIVLGLPFTNGLIDFDVDDGKSIKIDSGSLSLANGQVSLDPTTLSTDAPVQQLNLKVDHLGVNDLFKLINIGGLSGEGDIAGNIPVSLFPEGVLIKDAKLAATGPGVLKYDTGAAPDAVKNAGDSVNTALSALSDFHYKELVMTLQRQLTGDAALGLHINGSNPSFYNGYPVEFNFTASGRLDEILRQGLAGYQVPDMIEQRLNQFR